MKEASSRVAVTLRRYVIAAALTMASLPLLTPAPAGACWSIKLMAIKFMKKSGAGSTSGAIKGIEYAVHEGARIINCSFATGEKSSALQDEVNYAKSKNTLLVVAAGNEGENIDSKPSYPASFTEPNILTVAATTADGKLASFSNYGKKAVGSRYKNISGTSMAAPWVAGAAAMLAAKKSNETYTDLRNAITKHTHHLNSLNGKTVSGGLLDFGAALGN